MSLTDQGRGDEPAEDEVRWAAYMRSAQEGNGEAFETLLLEILPKVRSQALEKATRSYLWHYRQTNKLVRFCSTGLS